MLNLYVRHGVIVDNIHEIIFFKLSKWLEKYIKFNTQKSNESKNEFETEFHKLLNNAVYGKTMEHVRARSRLEFNKKGNAKNIIKHQQKLTFNAIHKPYENCDSYTFRQNET